MHLALASLAFAATRVAAALDVPRRHAEQGPLRDYVTLTKPRIMSLLLLTGGAGVLRRRGALLVAGRVRG